MAMISIGMDRIMTVGVIPYTSNNIALFSGNFLTLNGPAMISANYETLTIKHFTQSMTYYSCIIKPTKLRDTCQYPAPITALAFIRIEARVAIQNFVSANNEFTKQTNPSTFTSEFQKTYQVLFVLTPITDVTLLKSVIVMVYQ